MWKPGQCVTILGIQYRVTKRKEFESTCVACELRPKYITICHKLCGHRLLSGMPQDCYLIKIIKPYAKGKSAK